MKLTLAQVQVSFPQAVEVRGKVWLDHAQVDRLLDGVPISFTRRRYGAGGMNPTTYTWSYAYIGNDWVDLGDPWPCINPPLAALRQEIDRRKPQKVYA